MSEMSLILDEAEVERLIAERANLAFQRNAVAARIDEIDRALHASGEARLRASQPPRVTHQYPLDGEEGPVLCCGLDPSRVPLTDRMTLDPARVTCGKGGVQP